MTWRKATAGNVRAGDVIRIRRWLLPDKTIRVVAVQGGPRRPVTLTRRGGRQISLKPRARVDIRDDQGRYNRGP